MRSLDIIRTFVGILAITLLAMGCNSRRAPAESGEPPATAVDSAATRQQDVVPVAAATQTSEQPLVVEVYTDLVCPFCFIGTERLDRAIAASGLGDRVVVRHRSYLLRPDTPPEGIDIQAYLRQRTGRDPSESWGRIEAMARQSGIDDLDLSKQRINPPTVYAHALLRAAENRGTQRDIERALYRAHFIEAVNISDPSVLASIATAHGFTEDEARRVVSDPAELTAVRRESEEGARRGVRGVPFFVFPNGETLSGAQSEATLLGFLERSAQWANEPRE